jgi:hypothetical protein
VSRYTETGPGMEDEALEAERFEADMEMAELTRAGNAMHRAQRAGICTHGSSVGYRRLPLTDLLLCAVTAG